MTTETELTDMHCTIIQHCTSSLIPKQCLVLTVTTEVQELVEMTPSIIWTKEVASKVDTTMS